MSYQYDPLNRLISTAASVRVSMSEVIGYNSMGNIIWMDTHEGFRTGSRTYHYMGNRLDNIDGGALSTGTYEYDANGNARIDGRLGTTVDYNYLNLPISFTNSGLSVAYTYDAMGKKLKKVSSTEGTTEYVDGIQ